MSIVHNVYFVLLTCFLMWTIFKIITEFVTILFLFSVSVFWPQGMWDLSSPTRDRTLTPWIERLNLNHWTSREVPIMRFLIVYTSCFVSFNVSLLVNFECRLYNRNVTLIYKELQAWIFTQYFLKKKKKKMETRK